MYQHTKFVLWIQTNGVLRKCEMCRYWLGFCQLQTSQPLNWWSWRVSWSPKVSGRWRTKEGLCTPSRLQQSSPSLSKMAGGEWGCSNTGSPDPVHGESIQPSHYQWHQRWATEESTVYLILEYDFDQLQYSKTENFTMTLGRHKRNGPQLMQ